MRISYLLKKRGYYCHFEATTLLLVLDLCAPATQREKIMPHWGTITTALPFAYPMVLTWRKCFIQNIFFISSTVCQINFRTSIKKYREKYNLILEYCKEQLSASCIPDGVVTSDSKHSTRSVCDICAYMQYLRLHTRHAVVLSFVKKFYTVLTNSLPLFLLTKHNRG